MKSDLCPATVSRASRRSLSILLATTAAFGTVASGCGSGSSHPQPAATAIDSTALTEQARAQLGTLIAGATPTTSGLNTVDSATLATVRSQFNSAYTANSSNSEAAFGLGVTDLAVSAQAVITVANSSLDRAQPTRRAAAVKASSAVLNALVRPVLLWSQTGIRGTLDTKSVAALATLPLARSRQEVTTTDVVSLDTALNGLLTALNRDIPLITAAANDAAFSFPLNGIGGVSTTTTIDQADARGFEAALYGARAALEVGLAYNFDPGTFAFNTSATSFLNAEDVNATVAISTISPGQYLPAAPFGTLQSNGKTLFASAKTDVSMAVTTISSDISLLQARTGTTTHLIPSTALTSDDYSQLQLALVAVQYALGGHALPIGGVTYNLSAWFANPPASLTALEPTYHILVDGSYTATAADYPDKTFGGLISGLPDSAFTPMVDAEGTFADLAATGIATPLESAIPTSLPSL